MGRRGADPGESTGVGGQPREGGGETSHTARQARQHSGKASEGVGP